jgi:hypothetical protein
MKTTNRSIAGMALLSTLLLATTPLEASSTIGARSIEISIRSDRGSTLSLYPVRTTSGAVKAYLEAHRGETYSIVARNLTRERIGVVVAVDGRNIINGELSNLEPHEPLYVLNPLGSAEYSGWRTSRDTVNRFYFTNESRSYAGAFGDGSAMGVIAVAVYAEREVEREYRPYGYGRSPLEKRGKIMGKEGPGTGYGETGYEPARGVHFEAGRRAETVLVKYEWRETLCRLGIIDDRRFNRLWDEASAPPPPRRWWRFQVTGNSR